MTRKSRKKTDDLLNKAVKADQVDDLVAKISTLENKNRTSQAQIRSLRKQLGDLDYIREAQEIVAEHEVNITRIARTPKSKKPEATAVLCLSDVHCGERVNSRAVNNLNEYNPEICRESVDYFWKAAADLIDVHRNGVNIKNILVWWGGDIMTGWLHEDQQETNHLTPPEEVGFSIDMCASGLDFLLRLKGIDKVTVAGSVGNHGRGTLKPRHNNRVSTSWEALIYEQAIASIKGPRWREKGHDQEPRLEWIPPEGKMNYVQVYDTLIRFTHGDDIRSGGGVGGITIPINKAIFRWDQAKQADLTVMGHFHTIHDLPNCVVNGSVIGYSPYSQSFGYEPPTQAFFLIDSRFGKRAFEPIHVRHNWK